MPDFYASLDLGQAQDYSALTIIQMIERAPDPEVATPRADKHAYDLRHVQRWKLGTSYPTIVDDVVSMMGREPLRSNGVLCIDQTGVGAAVGDLFARSERRIRLVRVLITGGSTPHRDEQTGVWHVPKTELVSTVQVALQSRRLRFPEALRMPEVARLIAELGTFQSKINIATGHESFEAWRDRDHDDLVLSLAIGLWYAKRNGGGIGVYI